MISNNGEAFVILYAKNTCTCAMKLLVTLNILTMVMNRTPFHLILFKCSYVLTSS